MTCDCLLPLLLNYQCSVARCGQKRPPRTACSRKVGSSGPRSGQVRGQRLCQTQVGHGEAAANGGSVSASPPRLHSALHPTITVCWTVSHSVTLQQSLSLRPVHGLCKTHLSSLLLCQHTLSACYSPVMNYCQLSCLLLRVCPNR